MASKKHQTTKPTRQQRAWRELIQKWETDEKLQIHMTEYYRNDIFNEPLTGLSSESKLMLQSVLAIISGMYMNAYNWDNITARNYAAVAEMLGKSIDANDHDLRLLERSKLLKPFPKELREVFTTDYQGGHYNMTYRRAKKIMDYLTSQQFIADMQPLQLAEIKKMYKATG